MAVATMFSLDVVWLLAGLCLLVFTAGFVWGRRSGRVEGTRVAAAAEPLWLREQAMLAGYCPVCGSEASWPRNRKHCSPAGG